MSLHCAKKSHRNTKNVRSNITQRSMQMATEHLCGENDRQ